MCVRDTGSRLRRVSHSGEKAGFLEKSPIHTSGLSAKSPAKSGYLVLRMGSGPN